MTKSTNRMSRTARATCVVLVRRLYVACDNIRPWYLIKKRFCLYMSVRVGRSSWKEAYAKHGEIGLFDWRDSEPCSEGFRSPLFTSSSTHWDGGGSG